VLYLTMSTGVGAGLVLDGRVVRGAHSQAGELGHAPLIEHGRRCACGLRGCLEAYTGGAALADQIREAIAKGRETAILGLAGDDPANISARHWCAAIRAGDPFALELRAEFIRHLARGLAFALATVDPEIVILGTIVRENPDLFLDALVERVRAVTRPELHATPIVCATLGDRLPARAALAVAALIP
jgi:glucokinase